MDHQQLATHLLKANAILYKKLALAKGKDAKTLWKGIDFIRELRSDLDDEFLRENPEKHHTESPYYKNKDLDD